MFGHPTFPGEGLHDLILTLYTGEVYWNLPLLRISSKFLIYMYAVSQLPWLVPLHSTPFPETIVVAVVVVHSRQDSEEQRLGLDCTEWKEVHNTEHLKVGVSSLVSRYQQLQS